MAAFAREREISAQNYYIKMYLDPFNKRVRIDDIRGDHEKAIGTCEEVAGQSNAEKLIVKARREQLSDFIEAGYQWEGQIDKYFLGSDCYFLCKYFSPERRRQSSFLKEEKILRDIRSTKRGKTELERLKGYMLTKVDEKDAEKLAALYKKVFEIYPTPLSDPDYIKRTMSDGTVYVAYRLNDDFVSAASAEINSDYKNAEITDCATVREHRKHGLMKWLICELENELIKRGIFCAYSLSRALSYGMNGALYQLGYRYRGRLLNNCFIYRDLENMNIWVKDLSRSHGE